MKDNFKSIPRNQESSIWTWFRGEIEDWSGEKISDEEIAILMKINQN